MHDRDYQRHFAATSTCHGHVDALETELRLLLRRRLGIGCRRNSSYYDRQCHSDKHLTHICSAVLRAVLFNFV